jgi:hypothetical protein
MKPELRVIEGGISVAEAAVEAEVQAALAAAAPDSPPPVQQEMPFAIVDGEPMSEPPRDLYIPPQALKVFLEAFEGPLDLLLYLIRRQNLNILDIPIAEITRQYMEYIELMHGMELELAGEYMLMAAMLAEIKSRMLLPRPAVEVSEEEEKVGFFGQLKNQIITGAGAILATVGTIFIDEIKSIVGIKEDETEQVQGTQQNNQQQQNVIINIPEQKAAETKTVVIKEQAAAPVEEKAPSKKTETEKRKEEGLDW